MKDISQTTSSPATKKGEIIAIDISYVKKMSIGGCKFWLRAEDLFTKFKWSYFLKKKSKTSEKIIDFINHLKTSKNVTVSNIECNNAGGNKNLRNNAMRDGLGVNFQFTAPYTPQQNSTIKRSFATSYGRIRAMLNATGIH